MTNKSEPNLESVQAAFIKEGLTIKDLRPATFVAALSNEKKDYHIGLTKSANLIRELVDKIIYPFLNNKNTA